MRNQQAIAHDIRNRFEQAPPWVRFAAILLFAERVALFAIRPSGVVGVVSLLAVVVVIWFLLEGSRIAWVISICWAATQVPAPFTYDAPGWVLVSATVVLISLLTNQSRAFVWTERVA